MKKVLVAGAASVALVVAAPVASAAPSKPIVAVAGPPSGLPIPISFKNVSCTLSNGYTTQTWSFVLPSMAVPYFQMALAQIQLRYPALTCTIS